LIERETGGRVVIDIYGSETLVKAADLYDALLTGIADICLIGPSFTPGRWPLVEIGHLPLLFRSSLICGLSMWEAHQMGLFGNELGEVKLLSCRPNNVYNIVSRNKPIKTLEDWKGQKCSSRGYVEAEMIKLFGAVPVDLGPAEVYDALAKGMIDMRCLEWEGQFIWRSYEVTKYRTDLVDMMIGASTCHGMSWDTYNSLPPDIQAVFDKYSGVWMTELTSANMDRENYWRRLMIIEHDKKVGNPPMYMLPEEERNRWIEHLAPLYDDYLQRLEDRGLPARACFEGLKKLSAKYEAMYPPMGDAHIAKIKEYGYEAVYPGWPPGYPEGFEWLEGK
jgi:TRAP-type C4-dicarboxylate transport system substrate-binding protein